MPGEVPRVPLREVVQNFDSKRIPLSSRERAKRRGPYPYHGATGVMDYVDDYLFEGLHLLLAEDGSVETKDGYPFLQLVNGRFWVNNHAHVLRGASDIDTSYLYYALSTIKIRPYMTGSVQAKLSQGIMNRIPIPFPEDASKRQAIACILGVLDDKIELNRRMNRTLEGTARAIFKSWFVDFDPVRTKATGHQPPGLKPDLAALFPDTFQESELGEIPKGWRVGRLGDIIDIHDSKRIPLSSRERQKRQGSYRYYGAAGIVDYVDDFLFDGIYVLVGEDGSVVTTSGNPVVQYVWGKFWVNNHAHVLRATSGVADEHLLLLLQQVYVTPFVTGAVQPKLSQTNMKAIPVIHGSPELNQAFGRIIDPLYAKLRMLHDEIGVLTALRDTLLPKLVSGELTVTEAERIAERCA